MSDIAGLSHVVRRRSGQHLRRHALGGPAVAAGARLSGSLVTAEIRG
ncbi:MAG: hypothetical protein HY352_04295 [Candidatus Omnitrophica bacterium]|nr:hypothetical protein [Candidatus Omnitrophota bacterium]